MRVIIYIGGIKGVGKTTLLSKVFEDSLIKSKYKRVKIAEKMFEIGKAKGLIKSYEELEKMDIEKQTEIRLEAFQRIMKEEGNLVFDGHYAISSSHGYFYGIPLEGIKKINYYLLLYHDPTVILERRKNDISKKRELNLKKIELDLKVEEAYAEFYSALGARPLIKIKSDNRALEKILNFLKEVKKNG